MSRGLEEVSDFGQKLQRRLRGAKCSLGVSEVLFSMSQIHEHYGLPFFMVHRSDVVMSGWPRRFKSSIVWKRTIRSKNRDVLIAAFTCANLEDPPALKLKSR